MDPLVEQYRMHKDGKIDEDIRTNSIKETQKFMIKLSFFAGVLLALSFVIWAEMIFLERFWLFRNFKILFSINQM